MQINNLLRALRKHNELKKDTERNMMIGALAKKKRRKLGMTQSDVADSICSISYLSKIETNKIVANRDCLRLLMERVNIPSWEINVLENGTDILEKGVSCIYSLDVAGYDEIMEDLSSVEGNQCVDVIKLGYYILKNDIKNAKTIIQNNLELTSSMEDSFLYVFSYFTSEYLYLVKDYEQALLIANDSSIIHRDDTLKTLFEDLKFRIYASTKRPMEAAEIYRNLLHKYTEELEVRRISYLIITMAKLALNEGAYEQAIMLTYSLDSFGEMTDSSLYNYIIGSSFFSLKKEITAKEYLEKIETTSPYFDLALDKLLKVLPNHEDFIVKAKEKSITSPSPFLDIFINEQMNTVKASFYNSDAFESSLSNYDFYDRIFLLRKKSRYLMSISHYKEACLINETIEELSQRFSLS